METVGVDYRASGKQSFLVTKKIMSQNFCSAPPDPAGELGPQSRAGIAWAPTSSDMESGGAEENAPEYLSEAGLGGDLNFFSLILFCL